MTQSGPYRLADGGRIDRSRAVEFSFDGRPLSGLVGDTLASALLANRVRVVGRSMKFRRPRGVFSCGVEEPNALVHLGEGGRAVPSARATVTPLYAGLRARSQAGWPSVRFDVLRVLDAAAPLFAAGFYNKTFMWPSWHWFEPAIRQLAGLGRVPLDADPDRYEVYNAHCDVLVVGGGAAGLSAALGAAEGGRRVWLVEQEEEIGGFARWSGTSIDGGSPGEWLRTIGIALTALPNVRVLTRTAAVGFYDHGVVALVESCHSDESARERLWILRTKHVVLATGACEQPLVFDHNDRPGIMLAGAAHRFLKCHAVAPGRRVLIATNNDSAYAVARDLAAASIRVVGVADSRTAVAAAVAEQARAANIPVYLQTFPISTAGPGVLRSVRLGPVGADAQRLAPPSVVACDALLVSGGWNPNVQLYAQAGGKLTWHGGTGAQVPAHAVAGVSMVGAAASVATIDIGPRISATGNPWRQWIDLRHDVTAGDLRLALQENYRSVEHVKRYTSLGMAVDQGKTASLAGIEVVARLQGLEPGAVGYTSMRPPVSPVTLGTIAGGARGELFAPWRETALHAWHAGHGAVLEQYGEWQRPACYLRPGETRDAAIRRELLMVRTGAGLFDASPLGKIEIHGPDAREFLDRFYINRLDTLQPGRARYGIMLRESGVIFDDGTITVLGDSHLLITTTSGAAGSVAAWLEEWRQCEWPLLRVAIVPVTEQWATLSLSGPKAREILAALHPSGELSSQAFPHLAVREARLLGALARIYRVSFSGELTYEINVPAAAAMSVWEALLREGRPHGLAPYGVEALLHLRMEKGYLHVGTDTDGTTVPDDVGWGAVAAGKARDFIGKRSLALPENVRPDRLQLVGLTLAQGECLRVGSHVHLRGSDRATDGWITSSGRLASDDSHVALALVRAGRSHVNEVVAVHDAPRSDSLAKIVTPMFYDPAGERLNG